MSVRWITSELGTAPAEEVLGRDDIVVIDVRTLLDKDGNDLAEVRERIEQGLVSLKLGQRTIVACDYGMSRSNAVAAGILSRFRSISFSSAVRLVVEATGETEIKATVLGAVRAAILSDTVEGIENSREVILVTGAGGATGLAVCKALRGRFSVLSPTHEELDLELGTTPLELYAEENQVSRIVHLANPRVSATNAGFGKSLTMLRNILDVCAQRDIGLFYPSSAEVYSGYAGTLYADENVPRLARGPLGEAKYLAEILIENWQKMMRLRCCTIRSTSVYGPGLAKPKFLNNFIQKAMENRTILTHRHSDEEPKLDMLFVDDFAQAIANAVISNCAEPLNIGTGSLTSTRTIAELICELTSSKSEIAYSATGAQPNSILMNTRKARRVIDWTAKTSLREGLKRTVDVFTKG